MVQFFTTTALTVRDVDCAWPKSLPSAAIETTARPEDDQN
jgi:hypothetical protein